MPERHDLEMPVSEDERSEINDERDPMKRMAIIFRLVEAAYERGWREAEEQWSAYVDTLERPHE